MSWLDPLLAIKTQQAGTTAGTRQTINFASGATVVDDPANDRVNVTIADTGITQLTGDVTAGPGSGSLAATVAKVNGVSVSGTPTSGQVIRATSGTASSWASVARGDITNTSGATGDLITGDATTLGRLGIGSTGQVLTVSGGVPVWATPSGGGGNYPAVDANHVHVYYGASTGGASIVSDKGGVNLTGATAGSLSAAPGFCYKFKNSITNTTQTQQNLTASINASVNVGYTIECVAYMSSTQIGSIAANTPMVQVQNQSGLYESIACMYKGAGSDFRSFLYLGFFVGDIARYWFNGCSLVTLDTTHHFMASWGYNGGTGFAAFIDGEQIANGSGGGGFSNGTLLVAVPPFMSIADIRISNIARTQAYARAAYTALKSM